MVFPDIQETLEQIKESGNKSDAGLNVDFGYSERLATCNKLITIDDLSQIFSEMYNNIVNFRKLCAQEQANNRFNNVGERNYDNMVTTLKFKISYFDGNSVEYDYNNFISIFNNISQLEEIKGISVYYHIAYVTRRLDLPSIFYNSSIHLFIKNNRVDVSFSLASADSNSKQLGVFIQNIFANAPCRYDKIIKKNKFITLVSDGAISFIPAFIICLLLLIFVPMARKLFAESYVLFPISCLTFMVIISELISPAGMKRLYANLLPSKKYVGYNKGAIYKDNIDKYVSECEVMIGKNTNNMACREKIIIKYALCKKMLLIEICILILTSFIVIFL